MSSIPTPSNGSTTNHRCPPWCDPHCCETIPADDECPEDTIYHASAPQERTYASGPDMPAEFTVYLKRTDLLPEIGSYGTEVIFRLDADHEILTGEWARLTPEAAEDLGHVLIANAAKARRVDQ